MLKKVQGLFTSRRSEEATSKSSAPEPPAARRGEMDPPRRSISRVSNETFETQLDELDRLFADELVATVQPRSLPEPEPETEQFKPDPPAPMPSWPPTDVDLLEVVEPAPGVEAPAGNGSIVAGLRSKQDIVNAFRHLLAAERAEAEAKAMLAPGGNPQAAEITLQKSVDLTTLRLKVEPRTDAEGRTVLSITVE